MDRTANAGTTLKWSVGSNPTLSASRIGPGASCPRADLRPEAGGSEALPLTGCVAFV